MTIVNNARYYLACTTLMVIGFNLCSCKQKANEEEAASLSVQGDIITVPSQSPLKTKLKESIVTVSAYSSQISTSGMIKAIPTQYAEVAPPFPGRVTKSHLKLGMNTNPETALFEINAPDFISAQKIFFQQKLQMQQAKRILKRQQDLMSHGIGTEKDLEEAQTSYDIERKEYENAVIGIKIFKVDPDHLVLGQPLVVRAPISGTVIENKVVTGQFIKDDASSIATIANLSKVWIVGQVKEKDIHHLHEKDACEIEVQAWPDEKIKGKIYHIDELVNEETRSLQVYIECSNPDNKLKPGMYATVNFMDAPGNVVMIPLKSLLQMNEANFVFVVRSDGKYEKRKIETGATSGSSVIVRSGLKAGEKIISEGGFYLLEAR